MKVYSLRWGILNLFGFKVGGIYFSSHPRSRSGQEASSSQNLQYEVRPLGRAEVKFTEEEVPLLTKRKEPGTECGAKREYPPLLTEELKDRPGLIVDLIA